MFQKHQNHLKVFSTKYKENRDIEFALIFFNSLTKTRIGHEDSLKKSFLEVFIKFGDRISEGSGGITESIDEEYVNISIYSPLSGSPLSLPLLIT